MERVRNLKDIKRDTEKEREQVQNNHIFFSAIQIFSKEKGACDL